MTAKNQGMHNRWFIESPLYMLANGEEIRQAARKAGVRLVDARYKTEFDAEAPGKPAEVLLDRYKKQGGSSDSNHPAPKSQEGQVAVDNTAAEKAAAAEAAAKAAKAKAEAAKAKAEAEANKAAEAKAEVAEKAAK